MTILQCTPSLLLRLASAPRLRVLTVGGERCSAEARRRLTEHLEAGVRVYHMYGLTEMSVWQTMTRLESKEMVARMSTSSTTEICLPLNVKAFTLCYSFGYRLS